MARSIQSLREAHIEFGATTFQVIPAALLPILNN